MSTSKHTPGPWRVCAACPSSVESADGVHTATIYSGGTASTDANARLIAAAPELLACVRSLVAHIDGDGASKQPCANARALIAAVDGK